MEDGDEEVLYQTELVQLFSEEDEVYIKWSHGPISNLLLTRFYIAS
jgi:hypothetical protein